MKNMSEKIIKIIENEKIEDKSPIILEGFPDVGLVGTISLSYIIQNLNFKEIGYIDSDYFPPIVSISKEGLKELIRIYNKDNIIAIFSEMPIPTRLLRPLARSIVEWAKEKNTKLFISLGGIPEPRRIDIDKPKIFLVANNPNIFKKIDINEAEILEEGYIVGLKALLLKETRKKDIDMISALAQSHYNYPDPGAAVEVTSFISSLLKFKIDLKPLIESAEEVRIKMKDLMRRTETTLTSQQKSRELELPPVYL